jgi:hypothetical protein
MDNYIDFTTKYGLSTGEFRKFHLSYSANRVLAWFAYFRLAGTAARPDGRDDSRRMNIREAAPSAVRRSGRDYATNFRSA